MKIDRLIGILTVLLQNEKSTAPELAGCFEVSRRTILRDIDTLAMAGIPIVATRGGDGGISIMDGYKINKSVLTSDEMQNLVAALKGLDSVSRQSNFESLISKLAPQNALLKQAIAEHQAVRFDYYYPKGEMPREIEPYFIQFIWSAWYVFGWCRLREDFRRFKLNRLWNLSLTDSRFSVRAIPTDKANGGYPYPEPYNVKILFDKSVRFRLIEEYGLNCYSETENGLFLSLDYTNKDYIL